MRTLALHGGARVAVVKDEWPDAFGFVSRGRLQLELRDGEPGPVPGRDAGFWLRGAGPRVLMNPGRGTATVHIVPLGPRPAPAPQAPHDSYRSMEERDEQHA